MKRIFNPIFLIAVLFVLCSSVFSKDIVNPKLSDTDNIVYIDPSYTGTGSDGSFEKPYTSWNDIASFNSNTQYLQKRGTRDVVYYTIELLNKKNIYIGVYGDGDDYAYVHNATISRRATFQFAVSSYCVIDGYHLTGTYNMQCGVRICDGQIAGGECKSNKIINCRIEKFKWAIRVMDLGHVPMDSILIENVEVNKTYDDGIFIQCWSSTKPITGLVINNCHIDSVNMAYQATGGGGEEVAEGDGIQLSRSIDKWVVKNTTIDRRNSSNKFCIIHNDPSDGAGTCTGIIENCTFYPPNIGDGGAALYLSGLDTVTFRYNKVHVNENSIALMSRWYTKFNCYYNIFTSEASSYTDRYFDLGGGANHFVNNVFYGSGQVFKYVLNTSPTTVYNNIFVNAGSVFGGATSTTYTDYNLYYNSTGSLYENHSVYDKDPQFRNADGADFRLLISSPCINRGKDTDYDVDMAGTSVPLDDIVDIGAYEYLGIETIAPSIPQNLKVTNITETSFDLSWDSSTDNVGVYGYYIYFNGEKYSFADTNSKSFTGLTQNSKFVIKIKAQDTNGNYSDFSDEIEVSTLASSDNESPSTPENLNAIRIAQTSFDLIWDASTDNVSVDAYDVYVDDELYATTDTCFCLVAALNASTSYHIRVLARDAVNNFSDSSSVLEVTTKELCTSSMDWNNTIFNKQSDDFYVEFDVKPNGDFMNGVLGVSNEGVTAFGEISCVIQFASEGVLKVYNGTKGYMADNEVTYYGERTYHFKMNISLKNKTYDVIVSSEGGEAILLATGYSFRKSNSSLNNFVIRSEFCVFTTSNVKVNGKEIGSSAIDEEKFTCSLYPNPADDKITISVAEISRINIISLSGSVVMSKTINGGITELPIDLSSGIYIVELVGSNGLALREKLIVR